MLIDDDISLHEIVIALFRNKYQVSAAASAEEGLRRIGHNKPDLILLDGNMPGMKGKVLLQQLKQSDLYKDIPVVMLTAHNQSAEVAEAIMIGALGYIVKPFEPGALVQRIDSILSKINCKILIADDDDAIRDILSNKFRNTGMKIVQAVDGESAFQLALQHQPHLAIIDWIMPGLDGLALLHKIKEDPHTASTKVVLLTVKHQEKDILEGLRLGAVDYIVKPFILEEVLMRCLRLLKDDRPAYDQQNDNQHTQHNKPHG